MAHNDFVFPASQWAATTVPTPDLLRHLDQRSFEGVNGDAGGVYAPKKPIVIGGSGLQLPNVTHTHAMAGLATGRSAAAGGAIILATQYPGLIPPRQRNTVQFLRDFAGMGESGNQLDGVVPGAVTLAGNNANSYLAAVIHPRRLHDGATLNRITLRMKVGGVPAAFPASGMPGFMVRRVDASGNASYLYQIPTRANSTTYAVGDLVVPTAQNGRQFRCIIAGTSASSQPAAFSSSAQLDAVTDGTVTWRSEVGPTSTTNHFARLALPTTTSAAFAAGAVQSIAMLCNVNNTIDTSTYGYAVEIRDYFATKDTFFSLTINQLGVNTMAPAF